MSWLEQPRASDAHRLAAEIANEPQWVVFDDALDEDRWASFELAEISLAAARWNGAAVVDQERLPPKS